MSAAPDLAPPPLHGGPRLQPAHFDPERVPVEVARYGSGGGVLGVGSPGKVGILELTFALRGPESSQSSEASKASDARQRTELVHHFQKSPLQIMRPLYYDEARPDIPYTYLMTTGGGVLHGDRHRMDLTFGAGTTAHLTTQAHTRLHRMECGYGTSLVTIDAAENSYVEYLPDPVIPYAHARYYQRTHATVHPSATLVLGETLYAGRLSRGERNAYDVYASDLEVDRPGGRPVAVDRMRLVPTERRIGGLAVLGDRDIVSTLYVVTPLARAQVIADTLHDTLSDTVVDDTRFGVSLLPDETGVWLRLLGDDTVTMAQANRAAWQATRELLTGLPAPRIRK